MTSYDTSTTRRFYLVAEGEVTEAEADAQWDSRESVLTYASDPDEALALADAMDRGECQPDNMTVNGVTVGCLAREHVPAMRA